ncbi:hypothetical protein Fmac_019424 [Flemingia macrophylla]|uniref:Uncharacterized protein n=1 Tax=Flemingia macrophylla TaxID=520843 RepID=A0ABD1M7R6_9FABA
MTLYFASLMASMQVKFRKDPRGSRFARQFGNFDKRVRGHEATRGRNTMHETLGESVFFFFSSLYIKIEEEKR